MAKDNNLPMFVCKIDEIEKLSQDDMSFWTMVIS
jgi:hypothetical protein